MYGGAPLFAALTFELTLAFAFALGRRRACSTIPAGALAGWVVCCADLVLLKGVTTALGTEGGLLGLGGIGT